SPPDRASRRRACLRVSRSGRGPWAPDNDIPPTPNRIGRPDSGRRESALASAAEGLCPAVSLTQARNRVRGGALPRTGHARKLHLSGFCSVQLKSRVPRKGFRAPSRFLSDLGGGH